jgi:DNA-binding transcriptional LysR family regulator
MKQAGFQPRVSYETADYALTVALVGVGLGVALVPASVLTQERFSGVVVRDLAGPQPAREICIVHRPRPSALVRQLIALISAAGADLGERIAAATGRPTSG